MPKFWPPQPEGVLLNPSQNVGYICRVVGKQGLGSRFGVWGLDLAHAGDRHTRSRASPVPARALFKRAVARFFWHPGRSFLKLSPPSTLLRPVSSLLSLLSLLSTFPSSPPSLALTMASRLAPGLVPCMSVHPPLPHPPLTHPPSSPPPHSSISNSSSQLICSRARSSSLLSSSSSSLLSSSSSSLLSPSSSSLLSSCPPCVCAYVNDCYYLTLILLITQEPHSCPLGNLVYMYTCMHMNIHVNIHVHACM